MSNVELMYSVNFLTRIISIKVGIKAEIKQVHFNLLGHGSVFAFGFAATGWHPREIGSAFHRAGGFTRIV
jgi:hypothetical protein